MKPVRLTLREKAETLRRELTAIGGGNSEAVKSLKQLLALPPP
jgi:hypothetical protein